MQTRTPAIPVAFLLCLAGCLPVRAADVIQVRVDPQQIELNGPGSVCRVLVQGEENGRLIDLTRDAVYSSSAPTIAAVNGRGIVRAVGDGQTNLQVTVAGQTLAVAVRVKGSREARAWSFATDIVPILSRFGCNASGCHGKAEGQNGFKLSVFGSDPPADHIALTREGRGRRIFPEAPEHSLLLRKLSGQVPHGGGARIPQASAEYALIRDWIAAGAPAGSPTAPTVASIRVEPRERLLSPQGRQQLRVTARWTDGRETDVTPLARFQTNHEGLATVEPDGLVQAGDVPGEAAIMASFLDAVDVFRAVIPRAEHIASYPNLPANNFIDTLTFAKLKKLEVLPSEPCTDAEFLRRVSLDVIGTLPTPEEARTFLKDMRPDRRARLVDTLLARPEFADYWALQWADLLRVDRQVLGPKRAYAYHQWIRDAVARNVPLDQFARELLTAEGPSAEVPATSFYKVVTKPGEIASTVSQVFLGVRIACAECHHHPFDRWSQADYYGMHSFFTGVRLQNGPLGEALSGEAATAVKHPRTGQMISPRPLGASEPSALSGDARTALADWMTRPENPYFARNLANRIWAHFLGRGLVEPVDDVRATNPPSNPELLDGLARNLIENRYDLKALIRTITASRVYQLSSKPNATNERDEQNASRALFRRLPAEVILDMISQATGIPERFEGMPLGTRAIQLWDSKVTHYFLKAFGRPIRTTSCTCERNAEPSVAQVLHLLNAPEIQAKLSHDSGAVARLVRRHSTDEPLIEELYLVFYSRPPSDAEMKKGLAFLRAQKDRRQGVEDLAWGLMNTVEFLFNH
jgi:hypothetical protein